MDPRDFSKTGYRYIIGIDLGTTNSAVGYVDLGAPAGEHALPPVRFFNIPQLVAPGEVAPRPILPSFLYLPGPYDLPAGATALPWNADQPDVIGEFAREQGVRVPGRLVASAKSWLSHAGVDRTAAILPWGAPDGVAQISPVDASTAYLAHIRAAWNAQMAGDRVDEMFERQLVILTVPASFDEVARELTVTAATRAGIPHAVLLEEPLAAFYAWLARHEADWDTLLEDGQIVLVCDIGGGTTDFTIVGVATEDGRLKLNRWAVGDHLLLGGDNMDLALGRQVETRLMGQPGKLEADRWVQLVHQCRKAKETLLGATGQEAVDITVMGSGGGLIAGTRKTQLTSTDVAELLLDGFFPAVADDAQPSTERRAGLTELGLPYAQDPAITRHLAAFWRRFGELLSQETGRATPFPDYILFNGGALTPEQLRRRLRTIVGHWFQAETGPDWQLPELSNPRPELAVAIGAAYYGLVRMGMGVRIGSGSPRAYYIGIQQEMPDAEAIAAVCLVPRGVQEGFDVRLNAPIFDALANQPVTFQVYTSTTRTGDQLGDVVSLELDEVSVLPPIRTVLRFGRKGVATRIPVQLAVRLTETGTLEIYCDSRKSEHRWPLQFDVRSEQEVADEERAEDGVSAAQVAAAQAVIQATFDGQVTSDNPPEQVRKRLEAALGMGKENWPATVIRQLGDTLLATRDTRAATFHHETFWLNLLGFCLRPGFGDPADELRMKQVWGLYLNGLRFPQKVQSRTEWWIFWRRVGAGLATGKQLQIYEQTLPSLQSGSERKSSKSNRFHLGTAEEVEVWMMLANLERLPGQAKVELGRRLLRRRDGQLAAKELWALSRFGARQPAYGPLDKVLPRAEAEAWIHKLLDNGLAPTPAAGHALVHLAQLTGDRTRDIPEDARNRVVTWLGGLSDPDHYIGLLLDPTRNLEQSEQEWVFGETLPVGLALIGESS